VSAPTLAQQVAEMEQSLADLTAAMWWVFEADWLHTREVIQNKDRLISRAGTFLHPQVEHESDDWSNRGRLLEAYRRAVVLLRAHGTEVER
jgi:hypothetical protein